GGIDLLFDHITVTWLKSYEHYLKIDLGNGINTVHSNFRSIRRIINLAINEEIISENKNPFKRFKLVLEKVKKDFLTEEELMLIQLAPLQRNSMKDHHRNMYVFSAYAGGLRISDIITLKWRHFDGERILMQTKKTASIVSIKLPSKAMEILEIYQRNDAKPEDFIFPVFRNDVDYTNPQRLFFAITNADEDVNTDLREIVKIVGLEKKVTFHSARHTFATRALRKGVRIEYVSKLMGHSSIATTQIYAQVVNAELDKAMAVFN
ncbi:MAG: site-specific integrase, partial [Bacteroidota bacterium]